MLNLGGVLSTDNGTDATGVVGPLGATGMRGWLSGIFQKVSGTLTVAFAAAQHVILDSGTVSVSNLPATQAVSGTVSVSNLPATQPISGTVSVGNFPVTQPVSVATMPTTPVTGTFFQATQPVSLATNTPDVTDRAARQLGHVTVDNVTLAVTQAALTKGTQGTAGVTTQDLKDAGRTYVTLTATGVVFITTAALMTLSINSGGTVTSAPSYTVPAGKTLRIQAIQFGVRFTTPSTTVTFASTTFVVREGAGSVTITSNVLHQDSKLAASNAPVPNSDLPIPDGLELPAGTTIGVSHLASAATLSEDVAIFGYLY